MLDKDLRQRLEACTALPSPPGVALRLLELFQDSSVRVTAVAKVIKNDPALSAKVLRIVNSPLYSLRRKVATLDHAISLLGVNAVQAVALSFSLAKNLPARHSRGVFKKYWKRSVISAACAQELGKVLNVSGRETLFMGGLLQDIGILAFREIMGESYLDILASVEGGHAKLVEQERQQFGADHAEVGTWLVQHWGLPEVLQQMVLGSHHPEDVDTRENWKGLVRCVALSGWLADIWADSPGREKAPLRALERAEKLLNLKKPVLERVLDSVSSSLVELSDLFDFELNSREEMDRLLDKAKEAMFLISLQSAVKIRQQTAEVDSLRVAVDEFKTLSERDSLTGLFNRAYLQDAVEEEFNHAVDRSKPLSLIMCDIDRFKDFNDTSGHDAGDTILRRVAHILSSRLRNCDHAVRYGGEEFVLLLHDTDEKGARIISERLRKAIELEKVALDSKNHVQVTLSFGYATYTGNTRFQNCRELLKAADRALYCAKRGGRNRVCGDSDPASR